MTKLNKIDVVVLCGGLGKRLRSEIGESQKTMAKVDGQPFLDILLKYLLQQGFRRAILCTGYQAESIEQYYRENDIGIEIEFSQETSALGTGGAIKNAASFVKSDPFFALNGDCYCSMDYQRLLDFHTAQRSCATLAVTRIKDRSDYGSIRLNEEKRIISFDEKMKEPPAGAGSKPEAYFINVGVYCFNREVFSLMPKKNRFSIEKDFFPSIIDQKFFGFEVAKELLDIGTPERLKRAKQILKDT